MRVACLTASICPTRTCLGTQHHQNTRTVNLPYLLLPVWLLCHTHHLSSRINISPASVNTKCWFILSLLNWPICIWCVCVLSGCIHCDNIYYNYHLSVASRAGDHSLVCRDLGGWVSTELSFCATHWKCLVWQRADLIGEQFNVVWFHCHEQDLPSFLLPSSKGEK